MGARFSEVRLSRRKINSNEPQTAHKTGETYVVLFRYDEMVALPAATPGGPDARAGASWNLVEQMRR